jgi:hypothetical protein
MGFRETDEREEFGGATYVKLLRPRQQKATDRLAA